MGQSQLVSQNIQGHNQILKSKKFHLELNYFMIP